MQAYRLAVRRRKGSETGARPFTGVETEFGRVTDIGSTLIGAALIFASFDLRASKIA